LVAAILLPLLFPLLWLCRVFTHKRQRPIAPLWTLASSGEQGSAPSVRLDRLLSNLGYGSRKEVQSLIRRGRASVAGQIEKDPSLKTRWSPDITIDGEPVDPAAGMVVLMHKPLGYVCSHTDKGSIVYDLLPPRWANRKPQLSTVGRLDKDTSGLLLFTDDGELLHRLASPKSAHKVSKRYHVTLAAPLDPKAETLFTSGRMLLDGESKPLLPADVQRLEGCSVYITLTEGRHRQVRRMVAAVGNDVVSLHRDRMGSLTLPTDLPHGSFRLLRSDELTALLTPPSQSA